MDKKRLKLAMKNKNISQKEMSEMLGANDATVRSWIKGTRAIQVEYLKRVCEILDVSADWLIGLRDE